MAKKAVNTKEPCAIYIVDTRDCANPSQHRPSTHAVQVAILLRTGGNTIEVHDCSNGIPRFRVTGKFTEEDELDSELRRIQNASLRFMPKPEVIVDKFEEGIPHPQKEVRE